MLTFSQYLKLSKSYLPAILCHPRTHFVVGNESCDLDSMVSALALAYLYYLTRYKNGQTKVIPLMNVTSTEFPARTENVHMLQKYHLDPKDLVYKDDVNFETLFKNQGLKISLVDHHVLNIEMKFLKECVADIHDHRPIDETEVWDENVEMNIQQVASCATIITEKFTKLFEECFCSTVHELLPVPNMLYETIIFDTVGLKPEADKAKELDVRMIEKLEETLKINESRSHLFDELWAAHNDCSRLTSLQLLSKDLKAVEDVFIPGLPMLVHDFLRRHDAKSALSAFFDKKGASVVVLLGIDARADVHRDLAVYDPNNSKLVPILKKRLLESALNLRSQTVAMPHLAYYKQENVKGSRKQVIPIIKEAIEIHKSQ